MSKSQYKKTPISIYIPQQVHGKLEKVANFLGVTKAGLVVIILVESKKIKLKDQEISDYANLLDEPNKIGVSVNITDQLYSDYKKTYRGLLSIHGYFAIMVYKFFEDNKIPEQAEPSEHFFRRFEVSATSNEAFTNFSKKYNISQTTLYNYALYTKKYLNSEPYDNAGQTVIKQFMNTDKLLDYLPKNSHDRKIIFSQMTSYYLSL